MKNIQAESTGCMPRQRLWAGILLSLVFVAVTGNGQQSFAQAATGSISDSVASADGVMIHYTVEGTGSPALVFVHGWCMDGNYWKDQVAAFRDSHIVITLDLAGHGRSGANRTDWTMPAFGADVAAVVKKLELKKVILIGHSMGGSVNIEAARALGDRVLGLIGVDTYQDLTTMPSEQQMQQFLAALGQNFPAVTSMFVHQLFPKDADSALVARVADSMSQCVPEVGLGAMKGLLSYDAAAALKDMRKPIRSVNSDLRPTNVEGNQKVAASFEVTYMPGHGHFLFLEDPKTFDGLLTTYVDELSGLKVKP